MSKVAGILSSLTPLPAVAVGFYYAVVTSPTRINRIKDFLDPDTIRSTVLQPFDGRNWDKNRHELAPLAE